MYHLAGVACTNLDIVVEWEKRNIRGIRRSREGVGLVYGSTGSTENIIVITRPNEHELHTANSKNALKFTQTKCLFINANKILQFG